MMTADTKDSTQPAGMGAMTGSGEPVVISEKGEWLKCDACGHVAFYEHGGLCSGCLARDTGRMDWPTDAEIAQSQNDQRQATASTNP